MEAVNRSGSGFWQGRRTPRSRDFQPCGISNFAATHTRCRSLGGRQARSAPRGSLLRKSGSSSSRFLACLRPLRPGLMTQHASCSELCCRAAGCANSRPLGALLRSRPATSCRPSSSASLCKFLFRFCSAKLATHFSPFQRLPLHCALPRVTEIYLLCPCYRPTNFAIAIAIAIEATKLPVTASYSSHSHRLTAYTHTHTE